MATEFLNAVEYVLRWEGGLKEAEAGDPGGITNHGISMRFLRSLPETSLRKYGVFVPVTEQTIRELTIDQARAMYQGEFWEHARFGEIRDDIVGCYVFDMAINMGIGQAIKLVQRSLWAMTFSRHGLKDDGVLGEFTLSRLNIIIPDIVMPVLAATRAGFYTMLVALDSRKEGELNGWLNRCYKIIA